MNPEISIVIPVFNEEENISILSSAIHRDMSDVMWPYECIFVDDGSTDESYKEMKKVCEEYDNFRIVRLKRNCGQTAALDAGFRASKGKYIVMMDADLQNDPSDIPLLLQKLMVMIWFMVGALRERIRW